MNYKVSFIPEFIIITPVFSVTWSFRNHSNMRIWWSRHIYDFYQYSGNRDTLSFKNLRYDSFSKNIIHQGCIKLIKSDIKDIYNVTKDYIANKCCSFELPINKTFWKIKCITVFTWIWKKSTLIMINSEHQILILEWFLKGHATLKTGVMMINSGINYTLLYIHIEKYDFKS